jgi:hypothetical protein
MTPSQTPYRQDSVPLIHCGALAIYEVLEAQQLLCPAAISPCEKSRDRRLAIMQLYRALDGWNFENAQRTHGR